MRIWGDSKWCSAHFCIIFNLHWYFVGIIGWIVIETTLQILSLIFSFVLSWFCPLRFTVSSWRLDWIRMWTSKQMNEWLMFTPIKNRARIKSKQKTKQKKANWRRKREAANMYGKHKIYITYMPNFSSHQPKFITN